jgi:signal transduction histidine kinase
MNSVSTRLFAAFLGIIAFVLIMVSFVLIVLLRNNPLVERQTFIRLNTAATQALRQALLAPDTAQAKRLAEQVAATYDVRVLVTAPDGTVLIDSAAVVAPALDLRRFRAARIDAAFPDARVGQARDALRRLWLYVARPLDAERVLVVASRPAPFAAFVFFAENLLLPLVEAAAIAALVAAVVAVAVARSIAHPLQRMAAVSHGIAQGDYSQVAPETGPDEVRALALSLNSMARQVQATAQSQREFLANVSHELKTPLTSIQGFAQAIVDGAADSPAATQRSANIIYSEAERMRRLVDSLLDLARLDAELRTLRRAPVDLRALLAGVVEQFGPRAKEQGVDLHPELPPTLPALVGDGDRLAQVFANLLDNALKHTPAGGAVTVRASPAEDAVEVQVADTGHGIPAADLERIFDRFYQVDKSRARSGGVGLGLAITKEIVAAHGGTLSVRSQAGAGATFTVRLPAVGQDDAAGGRRTG